MFVSTDGPAEIFGHFDGGIILQRKTYHDGATVAYGLPRLPIDGALFERETFFPDMGDGCLHNDIIGAKYRSVKIGVDIYNYGQDVVRFSIEMKHLVKVIHLSKVVIGKIGVVVHMSEPIYIVEAYLDVEIMAVCLFVGRLYHYRESFYSLIEIVSGNRQYALSIDAKVQCGFIYTQ